MSVPDVATLVNLRGLVPSVVSAQPPTVPVRWMLRHATVVIFGVATVIGSRSAGRAHRVPRLDQRAAPLDPSPPMTDQVISPR